MQAKLPQRKSPKGGPEWEELGYDIFSYSSQIGDYHPKNIKIDSPNDVASRWTCSSFGGVPQFIVLRLHQVSLLKTITFGKCNKIHPCGLKEFRVYGGLALSNMNEIFHFGLKNNTKAQTFHVRKNGFFPLKQVGPVEYVKIELLSTWHRKFDFALWYVGLHGITDAEIVRRSLVKHEKQQEMKEVRTALKKLRERNWMQAYQSLLKESQVQLEDPFFTSLYNQLMEGDFDKCEELLAQAKNADLFADFVERSHYILNWECLTPESTKQVPGARGGHQLCVDEEAGKLYLLGGWDGISELSDFWEYDISEGAWKLLSDDTNKEGGPGCCSCHKMCLDTQNKKIYLIGKYVEASEEENNDESDEEMRSDEDDATEGTDEGLMGMDTSESAATSSEGALNRNFLSSSQSGLRRSRLSREQSGNPFYCYNIESGSWNIISNNTAKDGGPKLCYDHQIAIDIDRQTIFLFGGKILAPKTREDETGSYSGLYAYHITTNEWKLLRKDNKQRKRDQVMEFKSRIGHSMLYDSEKQNLYIFQGQRSGIYLRDSYVYNVAEDQVKEFRGSIVEGESLDPYQKGSGPPSTFTQRGVLNSKSQEMYFFGGLTHDPITRQEVVTNKFWVYNITRDEWHCENGESGLRKGISVHSLNDSTQKQHVQRHKRKRHILLNQEQRENQENSKEKETDRKSFAVSRDFVSLSAPTRHNTPKSCYVPSKGATPGPRFAHQLVLDTKREEFYLYGGNPCLSDPGTRFNDFWRLRLTKPNKDSIYNRCLFMVRKQRFVEMCRTEGVAMSMEALSYLQTQIQPTVPHDDATLLQEIKHLASFLLSPPPLPGRTEAVAERTKVFAALLPFFPDSMLKQPT